MTVSLIVEFFVKSERLEFESIDRSFVGECGAECNACGYVGTIKEFGGDERIATALQQCWLSRDPVKEQFMPGPQAAMRPPSGRPPKRAQA